MSTATLRARARSLPTKNTVNAMLGSSAPDDFIKRSEEDRSKFSPEFAALDREFTQALAEETAAFLAADGTPAGCARVAGSSPATPTIFTNKTNRFED